MIQTFPNPPFKEKFDSETGLAMPFLCRLRAITGAGKTPILALTAKQLGDAVILWTTNRGAVIAQTKANLQPGGKYADLLPEGTTIHEIGEMDKYADLLPEGTTIHEIGEMDSTDWRDAMLAETGLTILLATVASFNQEGDKLKIHRESRQGTGGFSRLGNAFLSAEGVFPPCDFLSVFVKQLTFR
jgi:type III restriction enzyme